MKTRLKFKLLLMPFIALLALTSCVREYAPSIGESNGEATVTFSLAIPGPSRVSTRSLTVSDEGNVSEIDLLLFEGGVFRLTKPASTINNVNPTKKTFEVTLPEGTYDIVIIANGRASIQNANLQREVTSKIDALEALTHSLPVGTKWTSNTIQMWGYKDAVIIDENTDLTDQSGSGGQDNSIKMSRMVSKIEVELSAAAAGVDNSNFAITSVHLYNYNDRGKLVPNMTTGWDAVENKAIQPNIPSDVVKTKGPLVYTAADDATGTFFTPSRVINTIYTFEAEAGSTAGKLSNTCVVIGGSFNGSGDDTHFYRVDFVKADKSYLHLLRNHKYIFKINSITGEGFTTPEEAFTAGPVNIEADVVEWNDGTVGDVIFEGNYFLAIRPDSELEFGKSAETQTAEIKTDYPQGWEVTKITEADGMTPNSGWLTTDKVIGVLQPSGSFIAMDISTALNDTGIIRVGYIYVKAGRMELRIMVTQAEADRLKLTVTDVMNREVNTLNFDPTTPIEQLLKVSFEPKSADLNIEVTKMGMDYFNYGLGDILATGAYVGLNGAKNYELKPPVYDLLINPFLENISKVDFMVTDGVDQAVRTIYLKQVNYVTAPVIEPYYSLNNAVTHSLTIKSNSSWVVKDVTGEEIALSGTTFNDIRGWTGGSITGDTFSFQLVDDINGVHNRKTITIVLTDPTGKVPDQEVVLNLIACGTKVIPINRNIGTKVYPTHMYGDKCWMISHSKEGSAMATYYGVNSGDPRGYYYTWNQAFSPGNACPTGWKLPPREDFAVLMQMANADKNGVGKWWHTAGFPWTGNYNTISAKWARWYETGYVWESSAVGAYYDLDINIGFYGPNINSNAWMSVRCIEE